MLIVDVPRTRLIEHPTTKRYCLIDMLMPAGGGPPPHRHDFEEMLTLLEGELELTFRGKSHTVRAGSTVNVPANGPHAFKNVSSTTARMLCMCTPAGQDEFFLALGFPVEGRTSPTPKWPRKANCSRRCCRNIAPRW